MTKQKTDLVVLAAGMGSRFGSFKQMASFGPKGETIIDYSLYDARLAGFDRAVVIIKRAIEKEFRETAGKRLEKMMDVEYAFQEFEKVPAPFKVHPDRVKPLGTGHAVLCAKDQIKNPFCVINSDDFYGRESYQLIHEFLCTQPACCMAGYRLGNTLAETGGVNRGICSVTEDGYLSSIEETMNITRDSGISEDAVASMNMWGITPDILPLLEEDFTRFMAGLEDPLKGEHYLPIFMGDMVARGKTTVKVLNTPSKWYGVTYKEDTEALRAALARMYADGTYPENL